MRSVLEQNYPRLEYIVQDGGSTDGTVRILERHADRLHHWESTPDAGQAAAINAGFKHATGEILAYLNADDLLLPGSLAFVSRRFRDDPGIDVLYAHRIIVDEAGDEIGRWILPRHDDRTLEWIDVVPQETLFWRRALWQRIGGALDEQLDFAFDWDLLLRFRAAGARIVRVPRFLAAFRAHEGQKTSALMEELGKPEMRRVRERSLGKPVTRAEILRALAPFAARQIVYDWLYRTRILRY